jgi:hypothetical protein
MRILNQMNRKNDSQGTCGRLKMNWVSVDQRIQVPIRGCTR